MEELKDYLIQLDRVATDMIEHDIKEKTLEYAIASLFRFLDVSRLWDGKRRIQTIDFTYRNEISKLVYAINKVEDDNERDKYISDLIELHNNNLKFEVINPPIIYKKTKATKTKSNTANKLPRRRDVTSKVLSEPKDTPSYKEVYLNTNLVHNFKLR